MSDDIKLEVIKKTQDSLGKHIKKPPLTEKLLKKPPFRFLHDVISNVIRETGFLEGIFTPEELNNENVKDRDSKIAFLQKAIDAVKSITGIQLTARPSKIVAGHEPTKTNEFLQAIGKALEKKEGGKQKSKSSSQVKSHSKEKSKSRDTVKKKSSGASHDKTSKPLKDTENEENKKSTEVELLATNESVNDNQNNNVDDHKIMATSQPLGVSATTESELTASRSNLSSPKLMQSTTNSLDTREHKQEEQDGAKLDSPSITTPEKPLHEKKKKSAKINDAQVDITKEVTTVDTERKETGTPIEVGVFGNKTGSSDISPEPPSGHRITSARPKTARPASARPAAPRIRDRGEVVIQEEPRLPVGKVNVITDGDSIKEQDEFENFVVEETPLLASLEQETSAPSLRPASGDQSQHGHLVAQILETQKELEEDGQFLSGDKQIKRVEIEWESGQRREKEIANKEVDRLRNSIQTLTRAANPLGKLMDFLQEDVDAMQREHELWKMTNGQLQMELLQEQSLTEESVAPMKSHLQQLQQAIAEKLDEISALKATILKNDIKIQKLVSGGILQKSDIFA